MTGEKPYDTILANKEGDVRGWLDEHHPDWEEELDPKDMFGRGKMTSEAFALMEDICKDPSAYFEWGDDYKSEIKRLQKKIEETQEESSEPEGGYWVEEGLRDYLRDNAPFSTRVGDYR